MIFVGVGSSIGNAAEIFAAAEIFLKTKKILIKKKSRILRNPPIGNVAKNIFSNAVWQLQIPQKMGAENLLEILQNCEKFCGRKKTKKWADRALDLDILQFRDQKILTKNLQIPHPEIPRRAFVLLPWREICGENFAISHFGKIKNLLENLKINF